MASGRQYLSSGAADIDSRALSEGDVAAVDLVAAHVGNVAGVCTALQLKVTAAEGPAFTQAILHVRLSWAATCASDKYFGVIRCLLGCSGAGNLYLPG